MNVLNYVEKDNQFYPTPYLLAEYIKKNIAPKNVNRVLDCSAGKGDLLAPYKYSEKYAIEIDENLRAILESKEINVIGNDWFDYEGTDVFDLVVMNPPFSSGEKHFVRAVNHFKFTSTTIVCILNASTVRNPSYSLKKIIDQYGFSIEYKDFEFSDSERKTDVEIAILSGKLSDCAGVFDDLLDGMDLAESFDGGYLGGEDANIQVKERNNISVLCSNYQADVANAKKAIMFWDEFYKRSGDVGLYLTTQGERKMGDCLLSGAVNSIRKKYWTDLMSLQEFSKYLTGDDIWKLREFLEKNSKVDFTYNNVYKIIQKLLKTANETIEKSVLRLFASITNTYAYSDSRKNNVHLFDGWKTNEGKKVKEKFIFPLSCSPFNPVIDHHNEIDYQALENLANIEVCMGYFSGVFERNFSGGRQADYKKFLNEDGVYEDSFFKIKFYKKGTAHIIVKDEDVLRRFNIYCGTKLSMLPPSYGEKEFSDMSEEEKRVSRNFEKDYKVEKGLLRLPVNYPLLS